jgi:hypothetical protein
VHGIVLRFTKQNKAQYYYCFVPILLCKSMIYCSAGFDFVENDRMFSVIIFKHYCNIVFSTKLFWIYYSICVITLAASQYCIYSNNIRTQTVFTYCSCLHVPAITILFFSVFSNKFQLQIWFFTGKKLACKLTFVQGPLDFGNMREFYMRPLLRTVTNTA